MPRGQSSGHRALAHMLAAHSIATPKQAKEPILAPDTRHNTLGLPMPEEIKLYDFLLRQILDVEATLKRCKHHQKLLETLYGEKNSKTNIIGKITTATSEHFLNLISTKDTFFVNDWWNANNMEMPVGNASVFIKNQIIHLKFYFFLKLVSTIEAQLRLMIRNIYPGKCQNGTDSFKNIYIFLLTKFSILAKYKEAYDLARSIRNTIHNLGVHTDPSVTLRYKEKDYSFIQWKAVDFFSHELNVSLQNDLLDSIIEITESNEFKISTFASD